MKAADGCRVRILVMDADNRALPGMINDLAPTSSLNEVRVGLAESIAFYGRIASEEANVELRAIRDGCPHFNLTVTDQTAVAIPYLYSRRTALSPLVQCTVGTPLYSTFEQEFESLWQSSQAPA
jgi:hypothetical protein